MKYSKIVKIVLLVLMVISVAIGVWGFVADFNDASVDGLLRWAYVMVVLGIGIAVILGLAIAVINNPKSLIKMLIFLVGCAVIVGVAYFLAGGDPLVGYIGAQPSEGTLKMTDTILNLAYITCGAAILAIIAGACLEACRNRK